MRVLLTVFLAAGALAVGVPAASAQSLAAQASGAKSAHMVTPPSCTTAGCQQVQPTHKVLHPNVASFHKPQASH